MSKGLPRLVQMHEKWAKDGFEVIAVATDKASETKAVAHARKFITETLKVKYLTVHVDASTFDYPKKISLGNVPAAFIFDRENRWVKKLPSFDDKGEEVSTDFFRMMKIVLGAGYKGWVGIEYEGSKHSERDGVLATKNLLERVRDRFA